MGVCQSFASLMSVQGHACPLTGDGQAGISTPLPAEGIKGPRFTVSPSPLPTLLEGHVCFTLSPSDLFGRDYFPRLSPPPLWAMTVDTASIRKSRQVVLLW